MIQKHSLFELEKDDEYDAGFHDAHGNFLSRKLLLMKFRGESIGIATLDVTPEGKCVARGLAIDAARQGQGHGRALAVLTGSFAASFGASELCVNAGTLTSKFYENCGFIPQVWSQKEIDEWNAGGARNPLPVQMVRRLP